MTHLSVILLLDVGPSDEQLLPNAALPGRGTSTRRSSCSLAGSFVARAFVSALSGPPPSRAGLGRSSGLARSGSRTLAFGSGSRSATLPVQRAPVVAGRYSLAHRSAWGLTPFIAVLLCSVLHAHVPDRILPGSVPPTS